MRADNAWYIEWVDHTEKLRWSGFVKGFDAAWQQFIELRRIASAEEWKQFEEGGELRSGRVRVGFATGATSEQMMRFNDALGFGRENFVGYASALAKLTDAERDPELSNQEAGCHRRF